jgi:mRNA-degrading endonuclease toxin of MazEF toxin-antitoxin module
MNRGDIWIIDLGGKIGNRPVVILTRQNVLEYLNKVTVVEITTKGKGYPTEVFIGQKGNLPKQSFVQADNIHTVPKNRLIKYLGTLDSSTMLEISYKTVMALQLEDCIINAEGTPPS